MGKIITLSSIKGGTGKTSLSILICKQLYEMGKKILCVDLDIQNALSFYFFPLEKDLPKGKHIANIFKGEPIRDNVINDLFVDVIPSHFSLLDSRPKSKDQLKIALEDIKAEYDYIIMDAAPTYDIVVLNACYAADLIISPAQLTLFDLKGLVFYYSKLIEEGQAGKWYALINRLKARSDNPETEANQYLKLFNESLDNRVLDIYIPESVTVKKAVDQQLKTSGPISEAIKNLCLELEAV